MKEKLQNFKEACLNIAKDKKGWKRIIDLTFIGIILGTIIMAVEYTISIPFLSGFIVAIPWYYWLILSIVSYSLIMVSRYLQQIEIERMK